MHPRLIAYLLPLLLMLTACAAPPPAPAESVSPAPVASKPPVPPAGPIAGVVKAQVSAAPPERPWVRDLYFATPEQGWLIFDKGGLVTSDGGRTWAPVDSVPRPAPKGTPATTPCLGEWAFDSFITPATGWVLCGWAEGAGFMSKAVHRTDDGGQTWTKLAEAVRGGNGKPEEDKQSPGGLHTGDYVAGLQFVDETTGFWWGSRYGSLMITRDGGATWSDYPETGLRMLRAYFLNADTGYVAGNGLQGGVVVATRDGGQTWTQVWPTSTPYKAYFLNSRVALGTGLRGTPGAVLRSDDGGETWLKSGALEGVDQIALVDEQRGWALVRHGTLENPRDFLYRTADGGATWQQAAALPTSAAIGTASFPDADTALLWDAEGNLLLTQDGGLSITRAGAMPSRLNGYGFQFIDASRGWAAHDFRLYATADGGKSWQEAPLPGYLKAQSVAVTPDGRVWAMLVDVRDEYTPVPMLVASADGGQTWTHYDLGSFRPGEVHASAQGSLWVASSGGGPGLVSHDGGQSWTHTETR